MRIANLKIGTRLSIGFAAVLILTTVLGVTAIYEMRHLEEDIVILHKHPLTVSNAVRDIRTNIVAIHRSMKDVALAESVEEISEASSLVDRYEAEVFKSFKLVRKRFLGNKSDVEKAEQAFSEWKVIRDEVILLMEKGEKRQAAEITKGKGAIHVKAMNKKIQIMIDFASSKADSLFSHSKSSSERATYLLIVFLVAALITGIVVSVLITLSIVSPLSQIVKKIRKVSTGDLSPEIDISRKDEIGELALSTHTMIRALGHAVAQADQIADGNYRINIVPRSDKDRLAVALQKMTQTLCEVSLENERQNWIKSGLNLLNEKMRGELKPPELARQVLSFLATYLDAQVGTLYVFDEERQELQFLDGYAFKKTEDFKDLIKPGEGLIGQAAQTKEAIFVSELPADFFHAINSSTGNALPRHLAVIPFMHENHLGGVIELGSFNAYSDREVEFLQLAIEAIAISFSAARANEKLKSLLEETQRQSEELESQSEELEAQTEELRQTNEEVRSKNEMLQARQKELELSGRYKSEFLANISHELRNPLNSMLILSQGLLKNREGNLTDKQRESVSIINKGGMDLLNLINDLLDISKIEAGKMYVEFSKVKLESLAESINASFKDMAKDRKLKWSINVSENAPEFISTDRHRLEQILRNLISNAIKFTEVGGVTVNFNRAPHYANLSKSNLDVKGCLMISVADTGIGIAPEKQDIIFNAFQQADGSTSRKYGGTGLGLSISSELAALLGGEIQLESRIETASEAGGSTFTLFLPLHGNGEPRPDIEDSSFRSLLINNNGVEDKKQAFSITDDRDRLTENNANLMLIIEDDMDFATQLRDQCHKRNLKVIVTPYGEDGLQMARKYKPAGIILDIELPGIDGWSFLELLKEDTETRHIPVHVVTVGEKDADSMGKGIVGLLKKPATKEEIGNAIGRLARLSSKKEKDLLIVEDNEPVRKSISKLIGNSDVKTMEAATGKKALQLLKSGDFDCMILDLSLPDMTGFDLLKKLEEDKELIVPPVIIYTGREITHEEHKELLRFTDSIVIKNVKSEERLLDESALFLHRVVSKLPPEKQEKIGKLYDKDSILKGKKVLLVDDDMRSTYALSQELRDSGMKTLIADEGQAALDILEREPHIDLILTDIMMPNMDGYELIRKIREKKKFKKIPIIALTAKAMIEDRTKCIDAGANDYIVKPVNYNNLLSKLRIWLYN